MVHEKNSFKSYLCTFTGDFYPKERSGLENLVTGHLGNNSVKSFENPLVVREKIILRPSRHIV